MELELEADLMDIQPMHQYCRGLRDRITMLLVRFGMPLQTRESRPLLRNPMEPY